jgi:glyoxylase-like metal-dependent hydrolase (beta-lactamase superfamily II)
MKKIIKIISIVILSLLILFIILSGLFFMKFSSETKKMSPMETKLITNDIYCIKDKFINFYLIKSKDKYIAIDAGMDKKNILVELHKLNITPENIIAVFLTHTDRDHIGGLGLFKSAKIFISNEEEQIINGEKKRMMFFSNKLKYPYQKLNDGEELDILGIKIKCILTPGHTPGSMSYLINGQYLFTGDLLSLKNGKVDVFNEFFNMNTERERTSIKKISELVGVKLILTAHYGIVDNFDNAFK